jgi:hypothetical protein
MWKTSTYFKLLKLKKNIFSFGSDFLKIFNRRLFHFMAKTRFKQFHIFLAIVCTLCPCNFSNVSVLAMILKICLTELRS